MTITARFFALFREAAGRDRLTLAVPDDTTVDHLWPHLAAVEPGLARAAHLATFSGLAINGQWVKPGHPLHDGDEVAFLPPVSGG